MLLQKKLQNKKLCKSLYGFLSYGLSRQCPGPSTIIMVLGHLVNLFLGDEKITVFNKLKEKINFEKYNKINVIITHLHNDHCGSLSQLIFYL